MNNSVVTQLLRSVQTYMPTGLSLFVSDQILADMPYKSQVLLKPRGTTDQGYRED